MNKSKTVLDFSIEKYLIQQIFENLNLNYKYC